MALYIAMVVVKSSNVMGHVHINWGTRLMGRYPRFTRMKRLIFYGLY